MRRPLLLVALALLAGCAPEVRVDEAALRAARPTSLAVLPFELAVAAPSRRAAAQVEAVRVAVHARLAGKAWLHLELDEVDRRLTRAGLDRGRAATASTQLLARVLDVDAVVRGRITGLAHLQGGVVFRQAIEGELRLVDARAGVELARVEHTESRAGGLLVDYEQSLEAVQETIDDSSDLGFVRLAERFAEEVTDALPPPPEPARVVPPTVDEVQVERVRRDGGPVPAGEPLRSGDAVVVTARATPGLEAALDLAPGLAELPLVEEAPGRYRGAHDVVPGDVADGPPRVHVTDRFGVGAERALRDAPLRIDARSPAAPVGLAASAAGPGRVRLVFGDCPATAAPAVAFELLALDARGVPGRLGRVERAGAHEVVPPAGARRFAVAAVDARGVPGPLALVDAPPSGGAP